MAIGSEQSDAIVDRLKALCNEHGDVPYVIAIKDEDGYWRYSFKCGVIDSVLLMNIMTRCALEQETGEDVAQKLSGSVQGSCELVSRRNGKPYPDLKAINAMQLLESGVERIDVSAWCTACRPDIFYSHRQSGGLTGRQGAIACIK